MAEFHLQWNGSVVCLSIGIAFVGAYTAITLCEQFRLCSKENQPKLLSKEALMWLMATALGGVTIWAMHFVGMSAVTLIDPLGQPAVIYYRLDLTIVSLVVVILVCYAGIWISSRDGVYVSDNEDTIENFIKDAANMSIKELRAMRHKRYVLMITLFKNMGGIVIGGLITATGVCVMHYIGMEAMIVEDGKMEWDSGIVTASVIIAIVAATAAFWILFRLLALYPYIEMLRFASALVAAVAVNGMHYTGLAAMKLTYNPGGHTTSNTNQHVEQSIAMIGAIVASMIFLWGLILIVVADLRAWLYASTQVVRNADSMMKKLKKEIDTTYITNTVVPTAVVVRLHENYAAIRKHDYYSAKSSGQKSVSKNNNNPSAHSAVGITASSVTPAVRGLRNSFLFNRRMSRNSNGSNVSVAFPRDNVLAAAALPQSTTTTATNNNNEEKGTHQQHGGSKVGGHMVVTNDHEYVLDALDRITETDNVPAAAASNPISEVLEKPKVVVTAAAAGGGSGSSVRKTSSFGTSFRLKMSGKNAKIGARDYAPADEQPAAAGGGAEDDGVVHTHPQPDFGAQLGTYQADDEEAAALV